MKAKSRTEDIIQNGTDDRGWIEVDEGWFEATVQERVGWLAPRSTFLWLAVVDAILCTRVTP